MPRSLSNHSLPAAVAEMSTSRPSTPLEQPVSHTTATTDDVASHPLRESSIEAVVQETVSRVEGPSSSTIPAKHTVHPLGASSAALRVSFKELPIDSLDEDKPVAQSAEQSDASLDEPKRSANESENPSAALEASASGPSQTFRSPPASPIGNSTHARASTAPVPSTASQAAVHSLQTRRREMTAIPSSAQEQKRRPNSFSGPTSTPPTRPLNMTGSHSVGTPRTGENIGIARHLIPLSEIEASSPSRKRGSSMIMKKAPSNSELADPEKAGRRVARQRSEKEVLVGTPVKEGHENYVLMYDMLTGIRVAVSRCQAKPPRTLLMEDFTAAHKMTFDVAGNELTPSSLYDFKFKDYAPWVFRCVREAFCVDPAEYLLSLTGKYVLSELISAGKSGSFFYYSSDYRFIIKTVHHGEHKYLRKILQFYYEHVRVYPNTLLSRIFGLHRVKLPGNRKIHFVVMGNVFPPNKDIHEMYDLKGSTVGRDYPEELAKEDPRAVLKDLNWVRRARKLQLGPQKRQLFMEQLERDVEFLEKYKIMDYSLLIGIHDLKRGNRDKIRDKTLTVYEPNPDQMSRQPTAMSLSRTPTITSSTALGTKPNKRELRRMLSETDPIKLGPSSAQLPENIPSERSNCVFYQDDGGFAASGENNEPLSELYYIGVIDIFTKYNVSKKVEHYWKSFSHDRTQISAVNPIMYGRRFLKFMKATIKGFTAEDDAAVGSRRPSGTPIAPGIGTADGPGIPTPVDRQVLGGMEEEALPR